MLDNKINNLESIIKSNLDDKKNEFERYQKTKAGFLELKEIFSKNFQLVVTDLTLIINNMSDPEINKIEEKEDASPASIKRNLNLNWIPINSNTTDENIVKNSKQTVGSYWCARSEEVLDGAFICRILVGNIGDTPDWHHHAGIIKHDKYSAGSYYVDACLMLSSGIFQIPFQGSNSSNRYPQSWKTGDEIIIKRDFENDIWFGLNNEFDMLKSCKQEGSFRIAIGFLNCNKPQEVFKMVELKLLS